MDEQSTASDNADGADDAALVGTTGDALTTASTTLVEVSPGTAVVFGDVPTDLDLIDFGLLPAPDRVALSDALALVGNIASIAGNVANAVAGAQGLYRITDATRALLANGGQLAVKDGASLGTIFANGKMIAQARFIPAGVTTAQLAASLGPALAMVAIQMKLDEISDLVKINIALTTQTLKAIRHEQWSELTGLADTINSAVADAKAIESVTESLWDHIAGSGAPLGKQLELYQRNVKEHVQQIRHLTGPPRRQYLETHAEAILFDANALVVSLKAHVEYQGLRAARSRSRAIDDPKEAQLAELIARKATAEFESTFAEAQELIGALTRELNIIAQLPGRASIPLMKKRRESKAAQLTCNQLLSALAPLSGSLFRSTDNLWTPELVVTTDRPTSDQYLAVLKWFLKADEDLICLAVTSSELVAVTDQRIITASPRALLKRGEIEAEFPTAEMLFVRYSPGRSSTDRASIDVLTGKSDYRWTFPSTIDESEVDALAAHLQNLAAEAADHADPAIEPSLHNRAEGSAGRTDAGS